jgi:hypothetical protein
LSFSQAGFASAAACEGATIEIPNEKMQIARQKSNFFEHKVD